MCGIVGFINNKALAIQTHDELLALGETCAQQIEKRGPDSFGVWASAPDQLVLAHRRLAIVDLSPTGHQPMTSPSGRYVVTYNGEIYNFHRIKKELEPFNIKFRGQSDTEVFLAGCEIWGIAATIQKCIGMFAMAIWDTVEKRLTLIRDRLGVKPLYYGRVQGAFFFSSQPKALFPHPQWQTQLSQTALESYLTLHCVPAPLSIFAGLNQLEPGYLAQISPAGDVEKIEPFWQLGSDLGCEASAFDDITALNKMEALLTDAVSLRMIADVPLGAFLSGGVDSSTVVALMQKASHRPVKTFSIGFHEDKYNEAIYAKKVAQTLGTDHTELYVDARQALDLVPELPSYYDEPFSDSSQIPTILISKLTRQHVTVALSGDGGDELFAGYNRYLLAENLRWAFRVLPFSLRKSLHVGLKSISPARWDRLFGVLPVGLVPTLIGDKLHKLANVLATPDFAHVYLKLVNGWAGSGAILSSSTGQHAALTAHRHINVRSRHLVDDLQKFDLATYLPNDVLAKVDRASMGHALEVRVPMLDHRFVEFAFSLPLRHKIRQGKSKWLLRQLLYKYVPKELIERPKMGFAVPIAEWLRSDLKAWALDLLQPEFLRQQNLFDPKVIQQTWTEHLSGKRNWQSQLWNILMFQAWYRQWIDK